MSTSTTLTLSPVASSDNVQQTYYQNISNSSNNNSASYYYFPQQGAAEEAAPAADDLLKRTYVCKNATSYTSLPVEGTLLLEHSRHAASVVLHKSNSYSGNIRAKATVLKHDSANGRTATSLTDDDISNYSAAKVGDATLSALTLSSDDYIAATFEDAGEDEFLMSGPSGSNGSASASGASNSRHSTRSYKARASFCLRAHSFLNRNWYLGCLVPLSIVFALMFVAYLTREYAKRLLYWIETQNPWIIFAIFMLLFVVVSFPVIVGYFVLMITAGYLFGCLKGLPIVVLGANVGVAIAHVTIRSLRRHIPMHKFIKNETGRAILRVISGPKAFKVVLFTRLTPIPFGIQNAIFGVSSINPRVYHTATFIGLLPAQTINAYLGSTLRSMHEVLNNHGTAVTGYISFAVEVVCGVALMFWVVQKARTELSDTLLSDISTEAKLINIEV